MKLFSTNCVCKVDIKFFFVTHFHQILTDFEHKYFTLSSSSDACVCDHW